MVRLKGSVEFGACETETRVAADFLQSKFVVVKSIEDANITLEVFQRTIEHLELVRRSLIPAILLAIPLGVIAAKRRRFGGIPALRPCCRRR